MNVPRSRRWLCVVGLVLASVATAQEKQTEPGATTWRGIWMATAGSTHSFRGRWWATLLPNTANAARGSWTLLSDSNQIVLEGTWSAKKSLRGWQGTWSARINGGSPFSGTWTSNIPDIEAKTFRDLLSTTINKQVGGFWQKGRAQGNWWLQGPY